MSGDAVLEDQAAIEVLNGPQFGLQDFGIAFHDTRLAYFAFCVKYIIIVLDEIAIELYDRTII